MQDSISTLLVTYLMVAYGEVAIGVITLVENSGATIDGAEYFPSLVPSLRGRWRIPLAMGLPVCGL